MNNICLLLLLAAISLTLFCQQNEMVLDSMYMYNWDSVTNEWIGINRDHYTYDANGNQTEEIDYYRHSGTNDWIKIVHNLQL